MARLVDDAGDDDVTRQLNELAAEIDTGMDPVAKELQRRTLSSQPPSSIVARLWRQPPDS